MEYLFVTAWIALSVLCSSSSLLLNVPHLAEVTCPSTYRVQASSRQVIELEVIDNKEECNRLTKTSPINDFVNGDVQPYVSFGFKDRQYRANISWDFYLRGKRLPRIFLISLTFYDIKDLQHPKYLNNTCVSMNLAGNRKVKTQGPVKFYFDCLPLLNESDIGLEVQLLSYSKSDRPCWSKRSVPKDVGLCDQNVQCSRKYSFPISKNAHTYRQCACYTKYHGSPKLNWNYDRRDGRFDVHFTNVPPYLKYAKIEIVEALSRVKLADDINVRMYNTHTGEIHESYALSGPEEQTIEVHLEIECDGPEMTELHYKSEIDDPCFSAGRGFYNYNVSKLFVSQIKSKNIQVTLGQTYRQALVGMVGGVVIVAILTILTTVICVLRHRGKLNERGSRSRTPRNEIELRNIHNEPTVRKSWNCPAVPCLLQNEAESEFCQTQTIENNRHQQMLNGEHGKHIDVEEHQTEVEIQSFIPKAKQNQEGISSGTNNTHSDRELSHTHTLLRIPQQRCTRPNESRIYRRVENTQIETTFKKVQAILLYYPDDDNPRHIQRVAEFEHILTGKFGVVIEKITIANWPYFAKSAFTRFPNVVLIISEGLYSVCHHYLDTDQKSEDLNLEQNRKIIPCIVLKKMYALVKKRSVRQQYAEQNNVFLHIVTLDDKGNDNHILQLFLNDHPFLTNEYYHVYNFCGNYLNSADIKPLIDRFNPTIDEGIPFELRQRLIDINMESEGSKLY